MIMKKLLSFLAVLVLLTGCGGGGGDSSSGGGSESIYAGTYTGTETWTISPPAASGVPSQTETTPLTVVVASNGDVTITDVDGSQYSGRLTDASLVATGTMDPIALPIVTCPAMNVTYTGTVSESTITGSFSGAYNCTVVSTGDTFKVTIQGTFTVMLQPAGATALGFKGTKRSMIENYVRDVVGR
jgi:hypothetical protein